MKYGQDAIRRLILLAFSLVLVGLGGCELDSVRADKKEKPPPDTTNTVTDGSAPAIQPDPNQDDSMMVTGTATLVVVNNTTHHFWPSLDDTTIGGTLIKLPHVDVGQSRSYSIPSGKHWLVIYSNESEMQYEAQAYFTIEVGTPVTFYYDTTLHQ